MRPQHPWHDAFAFLLLVNAALVIVLVLVATRHYSPGFPPTGQFLAGMVIVLSFLVLASLALSLLRLYIRPAIANGRERLKRNP